MMQVIDEDYIRGIAELPDGWTRLKDWFGSMMQQRDDAQAIALMCVRQTKDLKRQNRDLQAANTREVHARRDQRIELQAELDAAYAELDHLRSLTTGNVA